MKNLQKDQHRSWNWGSVFSSLLYACLFLFLLYPYSDFDWGWHYRYGEYFFTHRQLLRNDMFSWTMAGYEWINTSWAYDVIVYALFQLTGFFGLSVAGAIVSTLTFYVAVKSVNISDWQKGILAIFYFWLMKGVAWEGLRSQMLGLLFLSMIMHMLSQIDKVKRRTVFLIPLLFLFWANVHGSFVLGLFILGVMTAATFVVDEWRSKRLILTSIFVLSVLMTFINPFTYRNYLEIFHHFNSPLLRNIVEWMPAKFSLSNIEYDFFLMYPVLLGVGFWKRNNIHDLVPFLNSIFFGLFALTARRNWGAFVVVTLPCAALALKEFSRTVDTLKGKIAIVVRIGAVALLLFVVVIRLPKSHVWSYGFEEYCAFSSGCSERLVQYLLKNPPIGRGFNKYSWGSYLIGRGVNAPVFIDGRMAIWERDGFVPVKEYKQMYLLGDISTFNAYHFDWILAGNDFPLLHNIKSPTDLGEWTVAYSDDTATYLVRR